MDRVANYEVVKKFRSGWTGQGNTIQVRGRNAVDKHEQYLVQGLPSDCELVSGSEVTIFTKKDDITLKYGVIGITSEVCRKCAFGGNFPKSPGFGDLQEGDKCKWYWNREKTTEP